MREEYDCVVGGEVLRGNRGTGGKYVGMVFDDFFYQVITITATECLADISNQFW